MTAELLCLFKSSRRTEYTQENLRILSGAIGDEVGVAYKERWLSEDVRQRLPGPDDPVLIVLADPPYAKSQPIRKTCEPLMMKSGDGASRADDHGATTDAWPVHPGPASGPLKPDRV